MVSCVNRIWFSLTTLTSLSIESTWARSPERERFRSLLSFRSPGNGSADPLFRVLERLLSRWLLERLLSRLFERLLSRLLERLFSRRSLEQLFVFLLRSIEGERLTLSLDRPLLAASTIRFRMSELQLDSDRVTERA